MRCSVNGNLLRGLFCRKKRVVLRQDKAYICMESIDNKIVKSVSKRGRGTIVFPANFVSLGENTSVLKALERLASKGTLIRLARGWRGSFGRRAWDRWRVCHCCACSRCFPLP